MIKVLKFCVCMLFQAVMSSLQEVYFWDQKAIMIENHNSEATSRAHHHLCGINDKRMMDAWSEIYFFPLFALERIFL